MVGRKDSGGRRGGLSGPLGNVGFALAWLYHRAGAKVAVLDLDLVAAERTVAAIEQDGGTAKAFETDVLSQASTSAAVAAAAEEFGSLTWLRPPSAEEAQQASSAFRRRTGTEHST
ncbi:SDR family oxidoreductase [Nesterenkonia pannonica]|uniref:SDR family oxidoreductase n=1 Tax=Nesterenkonia pannonica TaxID=1548602 RepID=UPI0021647EFD|nr:SDR family oxidoreductase [Nesterenkonia pannonica]